MKHGAVARMQRVKRILETLERFEFFKCEEARCALNEAQSEAREIAALHVSDNDWQLFAVPVQASLARLHRQIAVAEDETAYHRNLMTAYAARKSVAETRYRALLRETQSQAQLRAAAEFVEAVLCKAGVSVSD